MWLPLRQLGEQTLVLGPDAVERVGSKHEPRLAQRNV